MSKPKRPLPLPTLFSYTSLSSQITSLLQLSPRNPLNSCTFCKRKHHLETFLCSCCNSLFCAKCKIKYSTDNRLNCSVCKKMTLLVELKYFVQRLEDMRNQEKKAILEGVKEIEGRMSEEEESKEVGELKKRFEEAKREIEVLTERVKLKGQNRSHSKRENKDSMIPNPQLTQIQKLPSLDSKRTKLPSITPSPNRSRTKLPHRQQSPESNNIESPQSSNSHQHRYKEGNYNSNARMYERMQKERMRNVMEEKGEDSKRVMDIKNAYRKVGKW